MLVLVHHAKSAVDLDVPPSRWELGEAGRAEASPFRYVVAARATKQPRHELEDAVHG
jgi:hypothetical protein